MTAVLAFCLAAAAAQDMQAGARAKAMAGVGTAFGDDPHSVWLNPAGIAAQPGGLALSYQSYPFYVEHGDPVQTAPARPKGNNPIFIPSHLGAVLQVGSAELPQAVGLGLVTPYHTHFPFRGPPGSETLVTDQSFHRMRASYAVDLRLRPAGEEGLFSHLALGLGADLATTRFEYTRNPADETPSDEDDARLSGGVGVLLGLYDNAQDLRVSLGLAYQGPASFDLGRRVVGSAGEIPFFDWPQQVQAGLAFYFLDRLPLRVCFEVQWTDWEGAAEESGLPGIDGFESALGLSTAVEYRIELAPTVGLLPRAGLRYWDAPWGDASKSDLPAMGNYQLIIDTRAEQFVIFSIGFGISWSYPEGTQDTLDVGLEIGGDTIGVALSYTFQF